MRRASLSCLVALALSADVLSGPAVAANTTRVRYYEGTTPEGATVLISVVVSNEVARLGDLGVTHAPYSCEDGTEGKTANGVGWGNLGAPSGPVIEDQHLELSDNWGVIAFTVSGRIGLHRGSGTLTFLLPGLTADEQAQVCTLGELAWTVERTPPPPWIPLGRAPVDQRLDDGRMVMMGEQATESGRGTAIAQTSARPVRHYRGRTSLDLRVAAFTQRVDTGIQLLHLGFGYRLACDDGSTLRGGWRQFPVPSDTVMPPGRFDMDFANVFEPAPAVALHIHGELDAHAGAGTLTHVQPQLTDALQAQLCTSGALTWELWRTDAGY